MPYKNNIYIKTAGTAGAQTEEKLLMELNAYPDKSLCCFAPLHGGRCAACNQKDKPLTTANALAPRSLLAGRYLIAKVLGTGGFGITYLGFDVRYAAMVAIKEYFPPIARRSEDYSVSVGFSDQLDFSKGIKRFMEEAKNMAEIRDLRGVVGVLDFFHDNNTAYIVMEYIDGITLKDYIKKSGGKIHIAEAVSILTPVFESLEETHARGIIHRDISPDNIIITTRGAKLIDYGAATQGGKKMDITLKKHFAPPEQYKRGYIDARTDVYALGVCIYFTVTGKLPPESVKRMHKETLIRPTKFCKLNPEQENAILKSMSIIPSDRFDSVLGFLEELMV